MGDLWVHLPMLCWVFTFFPKAWLMCPTIHIHPILPWVTFFFVSPDEKSPQSEMFCQCGRDGTKNSRSIKRHCRGALTQPPGLPRMKNKTTKTWSAWGGEVADLSKEKGPEPLSPGAFIRFIHIGIWIKLISHCQPVRVKQYKIYRELWGLILSYSQLVRGP